MRFVDTSILLYAVSGDPADRAKAAVAESILQGSDLALSVQVLQEFYVQRTRATRTNRLSYEEAKGFIESWLRFKVADMTVELMQAAVDSSLQYQLSYWDAAIIEAARLLGCREVLTEDLSHGQIYGGVKVHNPFRKGARRRRG